MAAPIVLSATTRLRVRAEALWAFLADTDRLNRAIGLPPVRFVPNADPNTPCHYRARIRLLGVTLTYEECPFDWVQGRHYQVVRRFPTGPIREVTGGIRLTPRNGETELEAFAKVLPRNWLGTVLTRTVLRRRAIRDLIEICRAFERHTLDPQGVRPPALPPPSLVHASQLEARLRSLAGYPVAPALVDRLRHHLLTASDLEVMRMRPFDLADRWGEERIDVLRLLLFATKAGLLDLTWTILCPNCRAVAGETLTLARLRSQAHCETCNIRFGVDLAASVEARFRVNQAVRLARHETYCIGGPANLPQIVAQLRLGPGERRLETLDLLPGPIRVRCFQTPEPVPLQVDDTGAGRTALRLRCAPAGLSLDAPRLQAGTVTIEAENALGGEALLVIERESWRQSAATGALVNSLHEFRELFPEEAVAPGEELGIACLTVLFTDLRGSTALYQTIGDPRAFTFVQHHLRYLGECVARRQGAVVKTMGDAVMATFAGARSALETAIEIQRHWVAFSKIYDECRDLTLKIGLHQGPSIAFNNRGRLDYFGATVNMAARVQGQSRGGDVVFTEAIYGDPDVRALLASASHPCEPFTAVLRGIEGDQTLYRIWPTGPVAASA